MLKYRLSRLSYSAVERRRRPVSSSLVAPVASWYASKAFVAIRTSVVPVSTMPAVDERIVVEPYEMDSSIPQ